eukprot:jgi/Tetstr1/439761/TSEL_028175.t1
MELSRLRRGIAGGRLGVSAEPRRLRSSHARGRAVRVAAATGDAKAALLAEVDGKQSRTALAELVLDLEAENPTPEPARSPLLAGQWRFAYSGGVAPGPVPSPTRPIALAMYAGGFTPGTLGLSVAGMLPDELVKTKGLRMKIVPSRDGVSSAMGFTSTATVNVELLGRKFVAQINCELVSESGVRLRETNKSVRIYTNSTDLPKELQYERAMFITYLDGDLMIARDETGCADILRRNKASSPAASRE